MRRADPAFVSQTIKLYAALLDAYMKHYKRVVVCEDDALTVVKRIPAVNAAMDTLGSRLRVLYTGGYKAGDLLRLGVYPKTNNFWPSVWPAKSSKRPQRTPNKVPYRSAGRVMAATGNIFTRPGLSRTSVQHLPVVTAIDYTISDDRVASANQPGRWVLKPFLFLADKTFNHERDGSDAWKSQQRLDTIIRNGTVNPFGYGESLTEAG